MAEVVIMPDYRSISNRLIATFEENPPILHVLPD